MHSFEFYNGETIKFWIICGKAEISNRKKQTTGKSLVSEERQESGKKIFARKKM